MMNAMDFNDLISRPLPTSKVSVNGFDLPLRALSSKDLDDMITRYPPEKGKEGNTAFNENLRFELIASTVVEPSMTPEQVRELLDAWDRASVVRLQSAVFDLNWSGSTEEKVPLSVTGSGETGDTPSN